MKFSAVMTVAALMLFAGQPVLADSLWSDTSTATFFTDRRPTFVIGGLITIVVDEKIQASQDANTRGNKQVQNNHRFQIPTPDNPQGTQAQLRLENQTQFNGSGATSRNGSLSFELTARIDDILPNGNLVVSAHKQVRVNDEVSDILISGVVRRDDVNRLNRVASSAIGDMKIDVKGTGPVSAKNTGGLLTRLFNFLL